MIPVLERQRREDSQNSLASQSNQIDKPQDAARDPVSKNKVDGAWGMTPEVDLWLPQFLHTPIHMHTRVPIHTKIHMNAHK